MRTTEELITEALLETQAIKDKVDETELDRVKNFPVDKLASSDNPYLRVLSVLITGTTAGKSDKAIYDQICISLKSMG